MGLAAFNRARRIAKEKLESDKLKGQQKSDPEKESGINFNELRAKAKQLKIDGYGKMNAEQLQEVIKTLEV